MSALLPARVLVAGLVLLALGACRRPPADSTAANLPVIPVRTTLVTAETLPAVIEVPGTVRPAERASIAAKLTGTVMSFPLGLGAALQAGDVLLTLNAPETEARVRQAQAQLAEADRNATRQRTLVAGGVNPPDALRDAEDRLRFAQAAAAEAEALFAYATVRAPFAGVITEKNILPGDLATPGAPLLVLESTQRLRVEGAIPEQAAASLRVGGSLSLRLEGASVATPGTIEELSAAADAMSRSLLVKVALPAGQGRSGQFARLQVVTGQTETLRVPVATVTRFGQMERVFVVQGGRATLRLVKAGREEAGRVELLAGVRAGETVVIDPPAALRDGQPVSPQP